MLGGRVRRGAAVVGVVLATLVLSAPAYAQSSKVVVIVEENQGYSKVVGSSSAPYLNSLISAGTLFTNYHAITSASLHNYLAMTSGLTATVSPPSPNVFQAIDQTARWAVPLHWTEFEESMTKNCGAGSIGTVPGTSVPLYTRGHDPAFQYRRNESCATDDVPMTPASFDPANLPDFSYVVPNQCDDMHTLPAGGRSCPAYFGPNSGSNAIRMGDNWLQTVVSQLLVQPDVTVLITWDEASKSNEQVATVEVGAGVSAGTTDARAYNHYGLLAGLYTTFELATAPNNAATATPLPIP